MLEVDDASNELPVARTLVHLADTTAPEFTPVGLLRSLAEAAVQILGVDAAGVYAHESDGYLLKMATAFGQTTDHIDRMETLFDRLASEGPTKLCIERHTLVAVAHIDGASALDTAATAAGIRGVQAFPLQLRESSLGCLALLQRADPILSPAEIAIAEALSDMAAIALLHYRSATTATALIEQLTAALESRVIIEQAKGIIAEREGVGVEHAFNLLRNHSRNHNIRLRELAFAVVRGTSPVLLDRPTA